MTKIDIMELLGKKKPEQKTDTTNAGRPLPPISEVAKDLAAQKTEEKVEHKTIEADHTLNEIQEHAEKLKKIMETPNTRVDITKPEAFKDVAVPQAKEKAEAKKLVFPPQVLELIKNATAMQEEAARPPAPAEVPKREPTQQKLTAEEQMKLAESLAEKYVHEAEEIARKKSEFFQVPEQWRGKPDTWCLCDDCTFMQPSGIESEDPDMTKCCMNPTVPLFQYPLAHMRKRYNKYNLNMFSCPGFNDKTRVVQ